MEAIPEATVSAEKIDLIWVGAYYTPTGYGDEARGFTSALDLSHINLRTIPIIGKVDGVITPEQELWYAGIERTPVDVGQAIVVRHIVPHLFTEGIQGRVNIARTMFETDRLPYIWLRPCCQLDEIWVPSSFNLETFNNSGVPLEKLRVVPGGVDVSCFHPGAPPLKPVAQGGFTFFSMFNIGCRKGWDILLTAYCTEFKPQEDVTLLIKTARQGTPGSLYEQFGCFLKQLARQQAIPGLRIIDSYLPGASLPGLYTACDAFVLPSRGEAWGRSYSEAMACGLPTIGTKWGGNLEYMNAENSYLLEIEGLEDVPYLPDDPENGYYLGHQWAKPSVEHLRHLMRHVFEHRQEAKERGARARQDICDRWTWGQAASVVARELLKYSR